MTIPAETPEQLLARVRAEHGDEVAAVVARELVAPPHRRKQVPRRVGNKQMPGMAARGGGSVGAHSSVRRVVRERGDL